MNSIVNYYLTLLKILKNIFFFSIILDAWQGSLVLLDNNTLGISTFQLPIGPIGDSFKISLYVNIIDDTNVVTKYLNTSQVVVLKNELPQNGSCLVSPLSGVELKTNFTVTCMNWNDPDGSISAYEFYCKLKFI